MHVERLTRHVALVFRGTNFNAEPATRAVFDSNLNRVKLVRKLAPLCRHGLKSGRRIFEIAFRTDFRANRRVRANHYALATLDAYIRFPNRNILRDVALLPARRSYGISAVFRKRADRQAIAATRDHFGGHVPHKLRRFERHFRREFNGARSSCRNRDLAQMSKSCIYGGKVLPDDWLTSFAVTLAYELLDLRDRFIA